MPFLGHRMHGWEISWTKVRTVSMCCLLYSKKTTLSVNESNAHKVGTREAYSPKCLLLE